MHFAKAAFPEEIPKSSSKKKAILKMFRKIQRKKLLPDSIFINKVASCMPATLVVKNGSKGAILFEFYEFIHSIFLLSNCK